MRTVEKVDIRPMKCYFTVPGPPFGKQRPRHTKNGHTYTPEKTRQYESLVKEAYKLAGGTMIDGYVNVSVMAIFPIPKSTSKANKSKMIYQILKPDKRPDLDNITKSILDGLNGVAYKDDSSIVKIYARKEYGETPCVKVIVSNEE